MFCTDWSRNDLAQAPRLEEAAAFVADYEPATVTVVVIAAEYQ